MCIHIQLPGSGYFLPSILALQSILKPAALLTILGKITTLTGMGTIRIVNGDILYFLDMEKCFRYLRGYELQVVDKQNLVCTGITPGFVVRT